MRLHHELHRISTNVRFLTGSLLLPEHAAARAERLFLTPPKPQLPQSTFFDFVDAHAGFVEHRSRNLATWRWGPTDAPAVLLAHGWGGYAAQMRGFVPRLLQAGFRVIAYDQPAHGLSEGRLTGLPDFAGALAAVAAHHGDIRHVIAHSLGGAAVAIASARGLPLHSAVLVSPPSDLVGYSRRFARWYWMPEALRGAMQAAIEERFGLRWFELEIARLAPRLKTAALVIHDRDDAFVPWKQGAAMARAWPGARLLSTVGLGHGRILESGIAQQAAVDFLTGRSGVSSPAAPELPHPAPLY
ncbi:MAG: alpha/beta fold hydrolase [Candidatus Parcubacteria bacterium]|nr:alpha/beta fold hydrolase [Burkholderiales bacterium]